MTDALDQAALEPDRVMPDDVRRRLRSRVSPRSTSPRTYLATGLSATAVAGVAVLAMLGGAQLQNGGPGLSVAAGDSDLAEQGGWTQEDLRKGNHFWTAAERYDATANWAPAEAIQRCAADRPSWKPLLTASARGVTVVAFADGDERIFCELTAESLTLSRPVPAKKSAGEATIEMVSPLGTVAGLASADVTQVLLSPGSDPDPTDAAVISNGVFLRPNSVPAGSTSFQVKVNGALQTQQAPSSSQSHAVEDPNLKTNDLANCTRETDLPVADPGRWQRGAGHDLDGEHLQLWSYDGMLAICRTDASGIGSVEVVTKEDPTTTTEPELAAAKDLGATREIFFNFQPDSGGQSSDTVALAGAGLPTGAATVEVTRPRSDLLSTRVVGDTFLLTGIRLNETGTGTDPSTLTVRDADGAVLVRIDLADL
ncbi:hypothetical protein LWF15_11555 [Kineosporia rhizophila]|uniref:hypothetical protein n=1 Tax=Kineosporia rhizophila TaxID=84633 RepID=UPI001E629A89|nr:hypothetical protein [Kineosporia rhizophila]MCE0536146.1 hypothetical protein [Kineosporia rhizophila]